MSRLGGTLALALLLGGCAARQPFPTAMADLAQRVNRNRHDRAVIGDDLRRLHRA